MLQSDWTLIVSLLACLVLAVGSFRAHRLDWKRGTVMALAWASIFAFVALLASIYLRAEEAALIAKTSNII